MTHAIEEALKNLVIIREVFQYLDTKELLNVSEMNSLWRDEARSILRDKRRCIARLEVNKSCTRAKEFNDMVGRMNVNPFNGLTIFIGSHECDADLRHITMEEAYGNLLTMPCRHLEFEWLGQYSPSCLLSQFLLRLMAKSPTLEHLQIMESNPVDVSYEAGVEPGMEPELPKLKTLTVGYDGAFIDEFEFEECYRRKFLTILGRAPNLEEVKTIFDLRWTAYVPLEKMHTIQNMNFFWNTQHFETIVRLLDRLGEYEPKLHTISVQRSRMAQGNLEDCLNRFSSIIRSSSESLRKVKLDYRSALDLKIIRDRIPRLGNVKTLEFQVPQGRNALIARYLLRSPLSQIFPEVTTVSFSTAFDVNLAEYTGRDYAGEEFPMVDVKEVKFHCLQVSDVNVLELGLLFPFLYKFEAYVYVDVAPVFPFRELWSIWPILEELNILGEFKIQWDTNFDAAFCGIHPDEAAFFQEQDEAFLKGVHIVPVFPAISHTRRKKMKLLSIELETVTAVPPENIESPSGKLFLSKVTGLIALRNLPELEFVVRASEKLAEHLEHLKPFVKVLPPKSLEERGPESFLDEAVGDDPSELLDALGPDEEFTDEEFNGDSGEEDEEQEEDGNNI